MSETQVDGRLERLPRPLAGYTWDVALPLKTEYVMTELAIADTSPLPPHVIRQLLEKLGVTYQARHDQPGIPAAQRVQTVLL